MRQALLYAVNRDAIIEDAMQGEAVRADSPLLPGSWAESAVAEALQRGPGGGRGAAGRRRVQAQRAGRALPRRRHAAVRAGDQQRPGAAGRGPGGVAALDGAGGARDGNPQRHDGAATRPAAAPSLRGGAVRRHRRAGPRPVLAVAQQPDGPRGANVSNLQDPRFDRLLEQARGRRRRRSAGSSTAQFQELFAQEVPAIPLYAPTAVYVQTRSLEGVNVGLLMDSGSRFWQVQDWLFLLCESQVALAA